jgi:16S rRNA (adenine1518-N6/adenine1519-N6)-dimethyltransferase
MLFMLQKEVAERLAAKVNTEGYGRLSVMVQYYCQVEILFDVPPSAFYPPPQVMSSIVRLTPFSVIPYQANHYDFFATIVREAFNQRRKTLRNSLKHYLDDEAWAQILIHSNLRPENLSVENFIEIANSIYMRKKYS